MFIESNQRLLAATGQVVIEAEEYVETDIQTNTTTARKNVRLTGEKGRIEADQFTYNADSGLVEASGMVKLTTPEGITVQAGQIIYNINTEDARISGGVQLTAKDGTFLTAEWLDYHSGTGRITAFGGVKINAGQGIFETETLEYNLKDANGFRDV